MTAQSIVPVYTLTKFISILNFVQDIDAIYIPLWVIGAFVKLSVSMLILSYGLSEWTGYKKWKLLACVLTCLLFVYLLYSTHNIRLTNPVESKFLMLVFYPFVYFVMPLALWMIGRLKKRRNASAR